jgi:hypothetical protein
MDIQTKDLFLLVLGVLLGLPPAILISRYYFKRSFTKNLTPYLMFHASPMSGMSDMVRNALNIEFKNRKINNLIEAQFVVINDGEKALRDLIQPLTLRWPENTRVLDAEIVRSNPPNLATKIQLKPSNETPAEVQILFDLMNTREWFIVKVIADGPASSDQWEWSIVTDELPRSLAQRRLTLDDLSDLPVPPRRRAIFAGFSLAAAVTTWAVFQFLPALTEWQKANTSEGSLLSYAVGLLILGFVILGITTAGATAAYAGIATRGLRPLRRELPNLPDEVVADVWRGYSAQADVVEQLKQARKK